jgi:hypothetical protein
MTESKQRRTGRLTSFRNFMKRRSLKEDAAINTSGASLIALDGCRSAEERQSIIDGFSTNLNELNSEGRLVIVLADALD